MSDCHACGKTIPSNDSSSLVCLQCKRPWHGVCAEPQPTDGDSTTLRNWKCFRCVSPSGDIETSHFNAIMAQFTILNSALTDCKTQINNLTDLVSAQSQIISTCVADISDLRKENQSLNNNLKALENKVIKLENKNVPTTSESVFQESYERLKRSENIIITGVPESNNTEDDISKASEILENVIPKNHFQIKSAARLGKIDLNKPRVFRITLNSRDQRRYKVVIVKMSNKPLLVRRKIRRNCKYCNQSFESAMKLDLHGRNVHLKIKCPSCPSLFRTDEEVQTHLINHDLQCQFCVKSFGSFKEMESHDRTVHLTIECPYCNKMYRSDEQLQKHIEIKHKFQCEFCEKSFRSSEEMESHDRIVHLTMECLYCDKLYRSDEQLQKHVEYNHKFQCELCVKYFSSIEKLRNHDKYVHLTIECPKCDELFRKDDYLLNHLKNTHCNFNCTSCSKWFFPKKSEIFTPNRCMKGHHRNLAQWVQ
uniref:Zinc finger protein 225-like n=2 Tax=Diabrotica virgifera virgifera TaxID=50390 RepID=A0A6P7G5J8_DIAVI